MGRYVGIEWPDGWEDRGRVRGGAECPRCSNRLVYAVRKDGSFGSIVGCDNCLIMSRPGSRELVVVSTWTQQGTELVPYVPALQGTLVARAASATPVSAGLSPATGEIEPTARVLLAIAQELIATGVIEFVNGAPHLREEAASVPAAEIRLLGDLLAFGAQSRPAEATGEALERRGGPDRRSGSTRRRGDQLGRDQRDGAGSYRPLLVSGTY